MVECKPVPGRAAVRALPSIPREEHTTRNASGNAARDPHVRPEADHMGPAELRTRRAQRAVMALEDLCLALPHENVRTAERAHI